MLDTSQEAQYPIRQQPMEGQIIPPYKGTPCPFYGFTGCGDFFMGSPSGNCCGMEGDATPCALEMKHEFPNWDKCWKFNTYRHKAEVEKMMLEVDVSPEVFWPENFLAWSGIKLGAWFSYVMGREYP